MRGLNAYRSSAFQIVYAIFPGFELTFNDSTTETKFALRLFCFHCQASPLNKCSQNQTFFM
jgi:hypothetical protein